MDFAINAILTEDMGAGADVAALPGAWRRFAACLRAMSADERGAAIYERLASTLECVLAQAQDETLTLVEAARETGYSDDHLRRLIRDGRIPNAGRRHAPRVRRGDLPARKRGLRPDGGRPHPVSSKERIARLVVNSDTEVHDE